MDGCMLKVGGQQHQTDHMHGDTVSRKRWVLLQTTVHRAERGHAHLANVTTEEGRCSCRGTTTTDSVEQPLERTCSTTLTLSPTTQWSLSKPRFGSGWLLSLQNLRAMPWSTASGSLHPQTLRPGEYRVTVWQRISLTVD